MRSHVRRRPATSANALRGELITIATIDSLLSKVDSKYSLVHLAARRAREINDYYHSLGEGLGHYTPPLVEQVDSNKPLSIAMEEIAADKIVMQYPGEARSAIEGLLGEEVAAEAAEGTEGAEGPGWVEDDQQPSTGPGTVVSLDTAADDA